MNQKLPEYCIARIKGSDDRFSIFVEDYRGNYYSYIINPVALKKSDLEIICYLDEKKEPA